MDDKFWAHLDNLKKWVIDQTVFGPTMQNEAALKQNEWNTDWNSTNSLPAVLGQARQTRFKDHEGDYQFGLANSRVTSKGNPSMIGADQPVDGRGVWEVPSGTTGDPNKFQRYNGMSLDKMPGSEYTPKYDPLLYRKM